MRDESLYNAARFCLATGIPYGKSYLEMSLREHGAFAKAYTDMNKKRGG